MNENGPLGLGILKGRRMGSPRTEGERAARHKSIYGEGSILPERGSGQGALGLGVMNNVQERMSKILKR